MYHISRTVLQAVMCASLTHGAIVGRQPYAWSSVSLGGYGYVTGIVAHPTQANLVYARTDVGGAYRWDATNSAWIPLFETFPIKDGHLFGVDGIAVDPSDPAVVYVACGDYMDGFPERIGDVLRSADRGATWSRTGLNKYFRSNAENNRLDGECVAVKPDDSRIIIVGTRWNGLYRSADRAATWTAITGVPKGTLEVGIRTVLFDPVRPESVYVGISNDGVYRSTNAGLSFAKMSGSPANQSRMAIDRNGVLWVTAGHTESSNDVSPLGVYRFSNNQWVNRAPSAENGKGFGGLAINPNDPNNVAIAPHQWGVQGIYVSTDGGSTWTNKLQRTSSGQTNYTAVFGASWWQPDRISVNPSTIVMDPSDVKKIWFGDGAGIWRTNDITAATVTWTNLLKGHEELCLTSMVCPPSGAPLLVSCLDAGGLRVTNPSQYPTSAFTTQWSNGTAVAYCEGDPNYLVWLYRHHTGTCGGAYSTDNGVSWTNFISWPFGDPGKIAVSATKPNNGSPTLVLIPAGQAPRRSINNGQSWSAVSGISSTGIVPDYWRTDVPIVADKVDGNLFYIIDKAHGILYGSGNGGQTWTARNSRFAQINVYRDPVFVRTPFGRRGEVWVNNGRVGLYRSVNEGADFTAVTGVDSVLSFDFGKPAQDGGSYAVYVLGVIDGQEGLFRSDDLGANWLALTDTAHRFGNADMVAADRQVYGRVYLNGPPSRWGLPTANPIAVTASAPRRNTSVNKGIRLELLTCGTAHRTADGIFSVQGRMLPPKRSVRTRSVVVIVDEARQ